MVKILSRKVENVVDEIHQKVAVRQCWLYVLLGEDFRHALEGNCGQVEQDGYRVEWRPQIMRDLPDHEGSQLVTLLQFVHFYEKVPVLTDHRVNLITCEGGQLEYNLKVDLYVLVVDDPGLDDVVVSGVYRVRVLGVVDAQLCVVDNPLNVITQRDELLFVLLGDDVSSPFIILLLIFFAPGLDVVLGHEYYVLGFNRNRLPFLLSLEGFGSFLLLDLAVKFFLETEDCVDCFVLVEDLKILVYEDDPFLQVVYQLFSALLLIKFLLEFLQVLLEYVVVLLI